MIESRHASPGRIVCGVALALLLPGLGLVFARAWGAGVLLLLFEMTLGQAALAISLWWAPTSGPFLVILAIAAVALGLRLAAAVVVVRRLRAWQARPRWWQSAWAAALAWLAVSLGVDAQEPDFGWRAFSVPSGSMVPTLEVGDRFVADVRVAGERPASGTVIVFAAPDLEGTIYVKRVVGLPGDRVEVTTGHLTINGRPTPLQALPSVTTEDGDARRYRETLPGGRVATIQKLRDDGPFNDTAEFIVPPGNLFVMGDNRDNSLDSRSLGQRNGGAFGFVPIPNVLGRAALVYWPPGRALHPVE